VVVLESTHKLLVERAEVRCSTSCRISKEAANGSTVGTITELGADFTITDSKGTGSSKTPLQRDGSEDIVYYLVRECRQDVSTLSKEDQLTIFGMVDKYERNKSDNDTSSGSDVSSDDVIDCITALKKIRSLYNDLPNLHVQLILADLVAKGVVTFDEACTIKLKQNSKEQTGYLIDEIIVPSLKAEMSMKFKHFLGSVGM